MKLPQEFESRMKDILGEKFEEFIECYSGKPYRALRINTLKADSKLIRRRLQISENHTPFCDNSYYIPENIEHLGNHPLHHAGAFYIQEPSSSSVIEAVGINKGDYVLDLCAAPGGKSTQAAAKLCGTGFLLSNEFVVSRAQALVSNIERMGIPNAAIVSARPDVLCPQFKNFFDKVIVDAPCSGEGMFRKEQAAVENWSAENVAACAVRSIKIIDCAAEAVKPGGKLVYSTCTYSAEENEQVIEFFLKKNPNFHLIPIETDFGEKAFRRFAPETENIEFARRIFNFNGGEGHFVAVMKRDGESDKLEIKFSALKSTKHTEEEKLFARFFEENFDDRVPQNTVTVNGKVYIIPIELELNNVFVVRNGIYAGNCANGRFIPAHSLFNTPFLSPKKVIDIPADEAVIARFLHGEEIPCDGKGFTQVRVDGVPLGFGKVSNGIMKNYYPKGLRTM